jgi:DNA-binding response OmpR family regulator
MTLPDPLDDLTNIEPGLGGLNDRSGMEPGIGHRVRRPQYGLGWLEGLEAPSVPGRIKPLVILAAADADYAELVLIRAGGHGYDIRHDRDGKEAYNLICALEPNAVIATGSLLSINRYDLAQRIRKNTNERVRTVPILFMEAHFRATEVMAGFNSGTDDYLCKPLANERALLKALRRVVISCRRPEPLTALLNEDEDVHEVAAQYLLDTRPIGIEIGLRDLLWHAEPQVRARARAVLNRLGTAQAAAILSEHAASDISSPQEGGSG